MLISGRTTVFHETQGHICRIFHMLSHSVLFPLPFGENLFEIN
jgi:hypothetical protein